MSFSVFTEDTHDNAIANDAQTGLNRTWPAGYITPAATGTAIILYKIAQAYQ